MTTGEKIEVLNVVSDVFLEINTHFKTELEVHPGSDHGIDVEDEYDRIVNGIHTLKDIKFKITSRVTANHNYKNIGIQRRLTKIGAYAIKNLPYLENRLSSLLPDFTIKYRQFILLAFEKGLVIMPLFEKDKDEMEEDCYDRMSRSSHSYFDHLSSYEKNIEEINQHAQNGHNGDIQIGHIMVFIEISKPNPIIKKIKRFKWF